MLRPTKLLDRRHEVVSKNGDTAQLKPYEDEAIKETVDMQKECGFHAPTDGEYRRHMFWGEFFPNLNGMEEIEGPDVAIFREYAPDIAAFMEKGHKPGETIICTSKISHTGKSSYIPELEYMKSLVPKEEWKNIKLTLAAPNWYHFRYKEGKAYPSDVYGSDQEYFTDIAKAYQKELDILYKAGLRNVQVDDPNICCEC